MTMTTYVSPFRWFVPVLVVAVAGAAAWRDSSAVADDPYRLPDDTEPVSYELRIRLAAVGSRNGNDTYAGQVDIVMAAKRYTDTVTLNAGDLTVSALYGFEDAKTGRPVPVAGYACDAPAERLVVKLGKTIVPPRLYRFTVRFEGVLRTDFTGFHKHFYDSRDDSRWIAMTRFKPIYARTAFPCYDEPKYKTPYKISIARPNGYFSLSNMPLNRSEIDSRNGWTWDHFDTTKPIPTYLVAFMVSNFDKNTANSVDNTVAIYTRRELIDDTAYMMDQTTDLLKGVETFTRIPYMLPKLDLVGVPLRYTSNTGNWGLNSHKEFHLTLSNNSYAEDKIMGTTTVLHEIVHQWFGNMVTTPRWDYVWLNEGVCHYLKHYIADTIEPDWELYARFVENVHQRALAWDQYNDTHPLTYSVSTPREIVDGFDPIAVDKSAAVLRMLKHAVGDDNFRASLNKFLGDFAYATAGPKELWETFDYVLFDAGYVIDHDVTVNNSMYLWTERAGYPLITVNAASDGSVVATQKRFCLSDPDETADDETKWFVGLTYTTEKNTDFDDLTPAVWLKPEHERTTIPVPADSGWLLLNLQSTGFYRVNYDEKNWKLLLIQLITKPDEIHVLNRAQIVDDAYHLSKAGLVPYNYYISLLEYLLVENHVTPWTTAMVGLSEIMGRIRRYAEEYLKFKEYAKGLADILYGKMEDNLIDNGSTKIGWGKLTTWACKMGNARCEKTASKHFEAWMNGQRIPTEMEESALCIGVKTGNLTTWSKILRFYETAQSATRRQVALRALACVENVRILFNFLNRVVAPRLKGADRQSVEDFRVICESVAITPRGFGALANYLSDKLNEILALKDGHLFATVAYSALASNAATVEEIATMHEIRASLNSARPSAVAPPFVDKYQQKIVSNIQWMERDRGKIIDAIGNYSYTTRRIE